AASYQYVLYGMGYRTEIDALDTATTERLAARLREENARITGRMTSQLPRNRDLLDKIRQFGFQAI
ncbi:MAG: tryptophan halogenase, partial [Sphingomonas sp.]